MNRSLANVILGGYGTSSTGTGEAMKITGKAKEKYPCLDLYIYKKIRLLLKISCDLNTVHHG